MAVQPEDIRLLANDRFRHLLESRAVGQIGQNALLYTLLILIVNETGSSSYSTLLVTAFIGHSLFVVSVMVGQVVGAVVLAPLILKILSARASLGVAAAMFLWAAFIVSLVAGLRGRSDAEGAKRGEGGLIDALTAGWARLPPRA